MRVIKYLIFILFCFSVEYVQSAQQPNYWLQELERNAEKRRVQDSIFQVQDSLIMIWVKAPIKDRPNQFLDSLKENVTVKDGLYSNWNNKFNKNKAKRISTPLKMEREKWVLYTFALILLLFSVFKVFYSSQLRLMMHAFYNNTAFIQLNKNESIFNKWPFVLLFILFSFVAGLFLSMGFEALFSIQKANPILTFLYTSVVIFLLILVKIWAIKFLAYVLEIRSLAKEYVSMLYLSYFNSSIILLPILLAFLFLPVNEVAFLFTLSGALLTIVFAIQLLRIVFFILKDYKLSKFYLILYFCTLEIGPLFILVKLLDLNLN